METIGIWGLIISSMIVGACVYQEIILFIRYRKEKRLARFNFVLGQLGVGTPMVPRKGRQ